MSKLRTALALQRKVGTLLAGWTVRKYGDVLGSSEVALGGSSWLQGSDSGAVVL